MNDATSMESNCFVPSSEQSVPTTPCGERSFFPPPSSVSGHSTKPPITPILTRFHPRPNYIFPLNFYFILLTLQFSCFPLATKSVQSVHNKSISPFKCLAGGFFLFFLKSHIKSSKKIISLFCFLQTIMPYIEFRLPFRAAIVPISEASI